MGEITFLSAPAKVGRLEKNTYCSALAEVFRNFKKGAAKVQTLRFFTLWTDIGYGEIACIVKVFCSSKIPTIEVKVCNYG